MKRILSCFIILSIILSMLVGCGKETKINLKVDAAILNVGKQISNIEGNKNIVELKYASDSEMLTQMQLACENSKFELFYSPDNMSIALRNKNSGKIISSNPCNASLDENYSGSVANKLNSQIIITYLQDDKKLVDMYSSIDCADLGQYNIKTYKNGIEFEMSIGEEKEENAVPKVLSKDRYTKIIESVSEDSKDLLDMYYVFYKKSQLKESGILDIYPDVSTSEDLYFCNFEFNNREMTKLSAVFDEAKYTSEMRKNDSEKLNLGSSADSYPNFKLNLYYCLTDTGLKVTILNKSIKYNSDFPLLKITLLPYFGADYSSKDANGYLFIPDGTGSIINMNQNEPNRRIIITGDVYGENYSKLPKEQAEEKTEQYYLPVFGTVRNNSSGVFGIITNGDANSQITALLGRPNGNYYSVYPEFIYSNYEQYTKMSVIDNAWTNKEIYLYEKNVNNNDLSVDYTFLNNEEANYSYMAKIYHNHIYGKSSEAQEKSIINIETLGSALTKKSFLGFDYKDENVFTSYDDNIKIINYLSKNNAGKLSLQLRGWQEDGLDAIVSNKIRVSSDLGGKSKLSSLIKSCKEKDIRISLYNNISFVKNQGSLDGFNPKEDATRTLELKYAKNAILSPDTMQYNDGSYVVKASVYYKYLTSLIKSAKSISTDILNLGELGTSISSDYSKDKSESRGDSLNYIKNALKTNNNNKLAFDGGNAYVLPYAQLISYISNENSGFVGESSTVPFLQMVIGNSAVYNSKPINLEENNRYELLKCIESGTVPTFLLSYKNTSALKNTEYTSYYSVDYKILKENVLNSYKYVEKVFSSTKGTSVVKHNVLADGVSVSTYGNGQKVYVNKTSNDYILDNLTIPAMDYIIKG